MISLDERVALAGRAGLVLMTVRPNCGTELAHRRLDDAHQADCALPLLPPGMWYVKKDDVRALAVKPFPESSTRTRLMASLEEFLDDLARVYAASEVWVGGSFLTSKIDPNDVDVLVILNLEHFAEKSAEQRATTYATLLDHAALLCNGIDMSAMFAGDQILDRYFKGCFGYGPSGQCRGIAVLRPISSDRRRPG